MDLLRGRSSCAGLVARRYDQGFWCPGMLMIIRQPLIAFIGWDEGRQSFAATRIICRQVFLSAVFDHWFQCLGRLLAGRWPWKMSFNEGPARRDGALVASFVP
jgi:hypothetical protein